MIFDVARVLSVSGSQMEKNNQCPTVKKRRNYIMSALWRCFADMPMWDFSGVVLDVDSSLGGQGFKDTRRSLMEKMDDYLELAIRDRVGFNWMYSRYFRPPEKRATAEWIEPPLLVLGL